jgi:hypothetical protein
LYSVRVLTINEELLRSEDLFFSLINPAYLSPVTQSEIQAKFEKSSEICLPDFLHKESFAAAAQELQSLAGWHHTGPPNRYQHHCCQVLARLSGQSNPNNQPS